MSQPKRRRAANGQRVLTPTSSADRWAWECDHAHEAETVWWDHAGSQDEAYAALDQHNGQHHPHLTEEARRG